MNKVTITLDAEKIALEHIRDSLLQAIEQKAIEVVRSKLTEEEQSKITIRITDRSSEKMSLEVEGPQEVLDKLKCALE